MNCVGVEQITAGSGDVLPAVLSDDCEVGLLSKKKITFISCQYCIKTSTHYVEWANPPPKKRLIIKLYCSEITRTGIT
jgi:hypothetical protein